MSASSRINITIPNDELEYVKAFASSCKLTMSKAVLKLALEKLEDYDDMILKKTLDKRMADDTGERYSLEDFEKAFDELPE
jgi:hypothetical protein